MNFVQSILNSRTPLSFTALLLARVVRIAFAASLLLLCDSAYLVHPSLQFCTLYLLNLRLISSQICASTYYTCFANLLQETIICSSVWYFTRNGFKTLAMYTNTCSLAGTNISLVAFSFVKKDALVGCLLWFCQHMLYVLFNIWQNSQSSFSHPIIFYPSGCTKFQREGCWPSNCCVVIFPNW